MRAPFSDFPVAYLFYAFLFLTELEHDVTWKLSRIVHAPFFAGVTAPMGTVISPVLFNEIRSSETPPVTPDFRTQAPNKFVYWSYLLVIILLYFTLFFIDLDTGKSISLRPLFIVPIIIASLLFGRREIWFFSILGASLRVSAFLILDSNFDNFDFILWNLVPALIAYLFLGEFCYRMSSYIRSLYQELEILRSGVAGREDLIKSLMQERERGK